MDLWGSAVEETNKSFNTIQTALNDESSEEYKRYHDLIENYKTNIGSSTSWMEGSVGDKYDYGYGSMGAWAYADNLISQLEDYLLNGEKSAYASLFEKPTEETFTIKNAIDFLSNLNPDTKLRNQGDISTPDSEHALQEWLYAGYDMTTERGRDEFYTHFQQSLDSLGLTLDAFTSSELDPAAVKTEEDLFIWNLQRLLNSTDKENFQWEWYPNKPSTPETAFTPEEAPIPYSDIQGIYIPYSNPEKQASFAFEDEISQVEMRGISAETAFTPEEVAVKFIPEGFIESLEDSKNNSEIPQNFNITEPSETPEDIGEQVAAAITEGNEQMRSTVKEGLPVIMSEKSVNDIVQGIAATIAMGMAFRGGGASKASYSLTIDDNNMMF